MPGADPLQPKRPAAPEKRDAAEAERQPIADLPRPQAAISLIEKPLIARLQESDVMRTLGGILTNSQVADVARLGWPTLRAGFPLMTFLNAMREMRATLAKRAAANTLPVMAVIGAGDDEERSIAALNIALSAARDGTKVLLIDADCETRALSGKVAPFGNNAPSRLGRLSIGTKAARAINTANGLDPACRQSRWRQGERHEGERRGPQGYRPGAFRRRLRSRDPRRSGDAVEHGRPHAA